MTATTFLGTPARTMNPTKAHRPAVWEGILGAVYATDGETVQYFDYDHKGALEFAGVTDDADPRVSKYAGKVAYRGLVEGRRPSKGQKILWVVR